MPIDTLESLLVYCKDNGRVCPMPQRWAELDRMLPPGSGESGDRHPGAPLILAAWHHSPPLLKIARLDAHIRWAARHGALQEVAEFLRGLTEADWHHLGE